MVLAEDDGVWGCGLGWGLGVGFFVLALFLVVGLGLFLGVVRLLWLLIVGIGCLGWVVVISLSITDLLEIDLFPFMYNLLHRPFLLFFLQSLTIFPFSHISFSIRLLQPNLRHYRLTIVTLSNINHLYFRLIEIHNLYLLLLLRLGIFLSFDLLVDFSSYLLV